MMPATQVITDSRGLADLEGDWNELLDASASSSPFLSSAWLQAWWRHLSGSARLHVVVVRSGGQLVAIAPLMITRGRLPFSSRLEFLGTGHAGSDYLDLIVRRGWEIEAVEVMAGVINQMQIALHLDHLPPSPTAARLLHYLPSSGWTTLQASPAVCPFIRLAGHSWDSYLATLGSAHRANFRRRERSLQKEFTVRFTRVTTTEERHEALQALMQFHEQRWKSESGSTAFLSPALRAFHDEATRAALAAGTLRLSMLSLNDEPVAVMYGFAGGRTFYFYQHGFNEAYAKYSVGLVLMGMTIRNAIDEGLDEFDMLYGDETYKSLWAHERRPLGRLQLFPPHLGGSLRRRTAETRLALRGFAHQLGLKRPYAS